MDYDCAAFFTRLWTHIPEKQCDFYQQGLCKGIVPWVAYNLKYVWLQPCRVSKELTSFQTRIFGRAGRRGVYSRRLWVTPCPEVALLLVLYKQYQSAWCAPLWLIADAAIQPWFLEAGYWAGGGGGLGMRPKSSDARYKPAVPGTGVPDITWLLLNLTLLHVIDQPRHQGGTKECG